MVYFGSIWCKKITELNTYYRECRKVINLNPYFFKRFKCQDELISIYNKVLIEIDKGKENVNKVFEEVEQEKDTKLRKYVKTLLYGIEGEFKRLQNDIKEMINNVG